MAQTVANLFDVLKEVWTQNRLEKQFYDDTRWFDSVERTNKHTIGRRAQVPVHVDRGGGFSVLGAAGGNLNTAGAQKVDRADYELSYPWQPVAIEAGALDQADASGARSVVSAANLEVEGAIADLRKQICRMFVSNGDGLMAETETTTSNTVVQLDPTGLGFQAIERGWLYPDLVIDIGTAASPTSVVAGATITDVSEDEANPTITIDSAVTTAAGDFVSIAGARSGSSTFETNGLRNIVGSDTSVVGDIDPANVRRWKPAQVDTTTTSVSLDLTLDLQRSVYQKTGKYPSYVTTSTKQCSNLYALYQAQVRFQDEVKGAGNVESFKWNNLSINQDPDILDSDLYLLTLDSFLLTTAGGAGKPTWATETEGGGSNFRWTPGATAFHNAVRYPIQLATRRRNCNAAAIGLTD